VLGLDPGAWGAVAVACGLWPVAVQEMQAEAEGRIAAAERKAAALTRERDALKRSLESASGAGKLLAEKDAIIKEVGGGGGGCIIKEAACRLEGGCAALHARRHLPHPPRLHMHARFQRPTARSPRPGRRSTLRRVTS